MTIHVKIEEAGARLIELAAAVAQGEHVLLDGADGARFSLMQVAPGISPRSESELAEIGRKRRSAIGMWEKEMAGLDLSIEALKADRGDPEEKERRLLGPAA